MLKYAVLVVVVLGVPRVARSDDRWTSEVAIAAPSKLGGCAVGDLDAKRPGNEIVAVCGNGAFLLGEETFTGELGHMRINTTGPRCICGSQGCLDVLASARTLPPAGRRRGRAWKDELARRSRALGVGIANLLKVFHPPAVILNGVYNDYAPDVLPGLTEVLEHELSGIGLSPPEVVLD